MCHSSIRMAESHSVHFHCIWYSSSFHPQHWQAPFLPLCSVLGKKPKLNECNEPIFPVTQVWSTLFFLRKGKAAELFQLCDSPPQLGILRQFARACNTIEQNKKGAPEDRYFPANSSLICNTISSHIIVPLQLLLDDVFSIILGCFCQHIRNVSTLKKVCFFMLCSLRGSV